MLFTMLGMYSDKVEQNVNINEIPKIEIKRGGDGGD